MTRTTKTRPLLARAHPHVRHAVVVALAFTVFHGAASASRGHHGFQQPGQHPAPVVRAAPPSQPRPAGGAQGGRANQFVAHSGQNQEHLQQWMQTHSNMPLDQQQRALDNEPGFRQLSPDVQLRMHQRLAQLNGMTPEQRQRAYARTEAMERLAPEQRQQVRSALTNLGNLPKDRRIYVAREFRAMRYLPQPQRQVFLNSPAMRAQFSDEERQVLSGLFEVEPYLPPPTPAPPVPLPLPPR